MASVNFSSIVENVVGTLKKGSGVIFRRKVYSDGGKAIEGKHELYQREKRDYKRAPLREGELANINRFREAGRQMRAILADKESAEYLRWQAMFEKQLKKPERGMKVNEAGRPMPYVRIDAYIRAKLMAEMKAAVNQE